MRQQINLYKTLPHLSRNWFDEIVVLKIAIAFWVLLGVVTILQFIWLGWEKIDLTLLQKKFVSANANFAKDQKMEGAFDLVQLQNELAEKTQLLNLLHIKTQNEGGCALMSDYFKSLSDAQSPGLWLTHFVIAPGTKDLSLEGQTYDPLAVVSWLKNLGKTNCFSGVAFQTMSLERSQEEATKNLMVFKIDSARVSLQGAKK